MSDPADSAQKFIENQQEEILRRAVIVPSRKTRICIDCGEEIDPRRLAAYPYAMRDIACQTKHEENS